MEVGIGGGHRVPLDKMSFLIPAVLEFIMGVDHPGYHPQHGGIKFQMVVFDICVQRRYRNLHGQAHDDAHVVNIELKELSPVPAIQIYSCTFHMVSSRFLIRII